MSTPSEEIVAAASITETVSDSRGRSIVVKKMVPLDRMRMAKVVGPENVRNQLYLGLASLAFHVQSIDGDTIAKPINEMQLEFLVERLGDNGMDAVSAAVAKLYPKADEGADTVKN